jgi:quinol monooxygenase YgiN
MVYVFARITARPEAAQRLQQIFAELLAPTRAEPGCLRYEVYRHVSQPGVFQTVEQWRDSAAVDGHMASAHVARAFEQAGPLLGAAPDIASFERVF